METKQLILNYAKNSFYRNGYNKTSLRRLSINCNITHPTIFRHFESKEDIGYQVMKRCLENEREYFYKTYPDITCAELLMLAVCCNIRECYQDSKFGRFARELGDYAHKAFYEVYAMHCCKTFVTFYDKFTDDQNNFVFIKTIFEFCLSMFETKMSEKGELNENDVLAISYNVFSKIVNSKEDFERIQKINYKRYHETDLRKLDFFNPKHTI